MLTSRGRWTVALGLVAGLAGRVLAIPELFGLAAAAVVIALAALVRVRAARASVTVIAKVLPPIVNAGEGAVLEIVIEDSNAAGSLATSLVLVRDASQGPGLCQPEKVIVPRLSRGERARASFPLPTGRRGFVDAGGFIAIVSDPLGLARRPLATSRAARCVVLPWVEPLAAVVPEGLAFAAGASMRSAAERLVTGSSLLRPYAEGDDLRLVHWRTTARVGELMVREGGDKQGVERAMTTVLLEPGDEARPVDERDRAVEVAASLLSAAADASRAGMAGAWRLVTTTGLDSGTRRGAGPLAEALVALAGLEAARGADGDRLATVAGRLERPEPDDVLVVVGAFGESRPGAELLARLGRAYAAVVVVLVGAAEPGRQVDGAGSGAFGPVLSLQLPLGQPLGAIWGSDAGRGDPVSYERVAGGLGR